jgi:hypothetical protein
MIGGRRDGGKLEGEALKLNGNERDFFHGLSTDG